MVLRGIEPDAISSNSAIRACGAAEWQQALQIFARAQRNAAWHHVFGASTSMFDDFDIFRSILRRFGAKRALKPLDSGSGGDLRLDDQHLP